MSERKTLKLEQLVIWSDNPRHGLQMDDGKELSENEIINILIDVVGTTKMKNLITDIFNSKKLMGNVNPVAVLENGKYYVYDGNRRISSLKIIKNPSIIEDEILSKNILELTDNQDTSFVDEVFVYITDQEEAFNILDKTHNGEQDGLGMISWEAYQRDISLVKRGKIAKYSNAYTVSRILGYIQEKNFKIPYTDLDRLFGSKELKDFFGITSIDDSKSKEIKMATEMLLDYKKEKKFQSFSRQFNITATSAANAPINEFCNWVKNKTDLSKQRIIIMNSIELFVGQSFNFEQLKIRITDGFGKAVDYNQRDLSVKFFSPSGEDFTTIDTTIVGNWKVLISYDDLKHEQVLIVKNLLVPTITFDQYKLKVQKGCTQDLYDLVSSATNGYGEDVKPKLSIKALGCEKIQGNTFTAENDIGKYQIAYSFINVNDEPFAKVLTLEVIIDTGKVEGVQLNKDNIISFSSNVTVNINDITNSLINEINTLDLNKYKCVISSSVRSLLEISLNEIKTKSIVTFSNNDLETQIKEFIISLKNNGHELLTRICSSDTLRLSFKEEKNVIDSMNPRDIAAILHLGAHKSASRIDIFNLKEKCKSVSNLLVYIHYLLI